MDDFVTNSTFKEFSTRMDEVNKTQFARIERVENAMDKITNLTVSVEKMAVSIDTMAKELSRQGSRLEEIEAKPAEKWEKAVWLVVAAVLGAMVGFILKSVGIG